LNLSQCRVRPLTYGEPRRFDTSGGFTMVGKALGPILAVARQQPDAGHVAAHHHAVAVVLDLVNPLVADRRAW
jgi:hypothetical protein